MRSDNDKAQEREPDNDPQHAIDDMLVFREDFRQHNDLLVYAVKATADYKNCSVIVLDSKSGKRMRRWLADQRNQTE